MIVSWIKQTTPQLYRLLEVFTSLNFSANCKMDSYLSSSPDSKGFLFSSFNLSQEYLDLTLIQFHSVLLQILLYRCNQSYPCPYFSAFGLNMERYGVSHHIQSECAKIPNRITPNADTFFAVSVVWFSFASLQWESVSFLYIRIKSNHLYIISLL